MLSNTIEMKIPIYSALAMLFLLVILQPIQPFVLPVKKEESTFYLKKSEPTDSNPPSGRALSAISKKNEEIRVAPTLTDKEKKVLNFSPETRFWAGSKGRSEISNQSKQIARFFF